jgi:hydroxymethylglutaryl-CoA lyase
MAENAVVFEVGPRDGLQNEKTQVSFATKCEFVQGLLDAGLTQIELGAFVRPDKVPQMADTERLYAAVAAKRILLPRAKRTGLWGLVPNRHGLSRALAAGVDHIALFTAASETFNRRNIGMSVDASLKEFAEIMKLLRGKRVRVRGYVSTAFGCPFEGKIAPKKALRVIERLAELGIGEISVGDTIGVATPGDVAPVIVPALRALALKDTRGTALANALRALDLGVRIFDSSAGGLGGCPFAPGATGNLATEDLVYFLHGAGMKTGVDLDRLCETSLKLARRMRRPVTSRYLQAYSASGGGR